MRTSSDDYGAHPAAGVEDAQNNSARVPNRTLQVCGALPDNRLMPFANAPAHPPRRLLALETSTDQFSVAVGAGGQDADCAEVSGPGAAQSSLHILPTVQRLLAEADWPLHSLDAIVVARGPGSFTGLRTACAVAQGLAYGAQGAPGAQLQGALPVLPVDTLLALAEAARFEWVQAGRAVPPVIAAQLDARMGEMYVALYTCGAQGLSTQPWQAPRLCAPEDWSSFVRAQLPPGVLLEAGEVLFAGNVFEVYGAQFSDLPGPRCTALPTASALLRLAPRMLDAGAAVPAAEALPLYVRDKIAQTSAEREALRLSQIARLAEQTPAAPDVG